MSTEYLTEGNVLLSGVTITGTEGADGSTLSWTGLHSADDSDAGIFDIDEDGRLDAGTDTFTSDPVPFTGYTYTGSDGVEYPIFTDGAGNYAIIVPAAATQTVVPSAGTSNAYQAETADTGVYLCFAEGTCIATPEGGRAVETLRPGDLVSTHEGRPVAVKWLWSQVVSTRFGPAERLQLVRVRAGALGQGVPSRDLKLTADHALLLDGLLVNAAALVNGSSIDWVPTDEMGARFSVYHVETEAHDLIFAEGAAAETYIDYVGRRSFDNYAAYIERFGREETIPEMPQPRISSRRLLPPAMKDRLSRAG